MTATEIEAICRTDPEVSAARVISECGFARVNIILHGKDRRTAEDKLAILERIAKQIRPRALAGICYRLYTWHHWPELKADSQRHHVAADV